MLVDMNDPLARMNYEEVQRFLGFKCGRSVRNAIKNYGFPPGVVLTGRKRTWPARDVQRWYDERRSATPNA